MIDEADSHAAECYRRAGLLPSEPVSIRELFRALELPCPQPALIPHDATSVLVDGRWRVYYRRGLPVCRARRLIFHELGHYFYEHHWGLTPGRRLERLCDDFAVAMAVPLPLFVRAVSIRGEDVDALARAFRVHPGFIAVRLASMRSRSGVFPVATLPPIDDDDSESGVA